jgi:hypothetical protein
LCDATAGACNPPVCEPGEDFECDASGNLNECRQDRTGYQLREVCVSQAHCNATAGDCNDAPCDLNDWQCSGVQLQRCRSDRTGWSVQDTCDTAELCDAPGQTCDEPACQPGDYECAGTELLGCNAGQTGLVPIDTCDSVALCDATQGQCDVCTPGVYTCMGDDLHQCDTAGQAAPVAQECGAGRCFASGMSGGCYLCDVDEYRCSNGVLQRCAPNRLGFTAQMDCTDQSLCDEANGMCLPGGGGGAGN